MVNQTCKVCKFCEYNCVNVPILAGERENDDKNVSSDEGDGSALSTEEQAKFARHFETRHHAWLSIHHPDAVNSEVPI